MSRLPALRCALLLVTLVPWHTAFAHSFAPAVLDLREREVGVFDVVWKMPGAESGVLSPGDERVAPRLAVATAMAALRQGAARLALDEAEIRRLAVAKIGEARVATEALVRAGVIPPPN